MSRMGIVRVTCSSSITFLFVSCFIVYALSGAPDCFFRDFINVSLCWFA